VKVTKYKSAKSGKKESKQKSFDLAYIKIDSLEITELDSLDKTIAKTKFSFETRNLSADMPLTDLSSGDLIVTDFKMILPKSNYLVTLNQLKLKNMNHFQIDSLKIIPLYGKQEFIRRVGYETDRIECTFPQIDISGFDSHELINNKQLSIGEVALSFDLAVYRDKRAEDLKTFKPLPDSLLRKLLPLGVTIDTFRIRSSQIVYEEFAEKADSSGRVTFRKLEAMMYNISNRDPKEALELHAQAQFMNEGEIEVHGIFSNSDKPHVLMGSLKNFRLAKINQMLKPATGVSIESGKLDLMKFSFNYNDYESDGEMYLNYHDLKLLSFRENKDNEAVPNVVKTLLINAFIENDLDKKDPKSKRTGTIHFVRDRNKFIFNFWWKSLLSGLKSASGVPGSKPQAAS
jgi:hypothetical protein